MYQRVRKIKGPYIITDNMDIVNFWKKRHPGFCALGFLEGGKLYYRLRIIDDELLKYAEHMDEEVPICEER